MVVMRGRVVLTNLTSSVSYQSDPSSFSLSGMTYSLAATSLLLDGHARGSPLLLIPGTEALATEHEVLILDVDGLGPPVTLGGELLGLGRVVVLRLVVDVVGVR